MATTPAMLNVFGDLKSLKEELAQYLRHHKVNFLPEELSRELKALNDYFSSTKTDPTKSIFKYLEDLPDQIKQKREHRARKVYQIRDPNAEYNWSQTTLDKRKLKSDSIEYLKSLNSNSPVQFLNIHTKETFFFEKLSMAEKLFGCTAGSIINASKDMYLIQKKYVVIYNSKVLHKKINS